MKKVLLATTAIIAASAFASPAKAELQVTVGGFTAFQAAMFDDDTANSSERDFQSEAEIHVNADATADNGLQYGAKVVLNASTSDTDNASDVGIYLAGGWGRVELGDLDGASQLVVFAPTVGIGQINGSYDDYLQTGVDPYALNDRGDHNFTAMDSDTATKVTYYTPKYMGFQAGVSYAPEMKDNNGMGEEVALTDSTTLASDVAELGLGYEGEYSGVAFKVGGTYVMGDANAAGAEDLSAWTAGAQAGYMGWTFGGAYTDNGDSLAASGTDNNNWNLGLTYENGPWGVGVSYLSAELSSGDYEATVLGGTYTVAPGLTVGADLAFYDRETADDGYVLVTDVTAAF